MSVTIISVFILSDIPEGYQHLRDQPITRDTHAVFNVESQHYEYTLKYYDDAIHTRVATMQYNLVLLQAAVTHA